MTDQAVTLSIDRAGGAGPSGAQAFSGAAAERAQQAARESEGTPRQSKTSTEKSRADQSGTRARLVRDEKSGRSHIEILDRKTGEVMYQIPPESIQALSELLESATGSMVDTVA